MKEILFKPLQKEMAKLVVLFIISLFAFKVAFYKENILVLLKTVGSLFWLFVIPGYALMYYWHDTFNFFIRILIGIGLSAALTGILSYYFGVFVLPIKYHGIILPIILIIVGVFINKIKKIHKEWYFNVLFFFPLSFYNISLKNRL